MEAGDRVFVSYRREDGADIAGRICDRLSAALGEAAVFRDVDRGGNPSAWTSMRISAGGRTP